MQSSFSLIIHLKPEEVGLFHCLLESHGHLAYFTVLEHKTALLRLLFPQNNFHAVQKILNSMREDIIFSVSPWIFF